MKRIVLTLILLTTGLLAQTATTIYDIQSGAIAEDTEVQVKGIVTAGSGETPDGSAAIYVQDGTGAYSGINVYASGYSVSRGDSVNLTGTYAEYYGKSQIKDITALTIINSGNSLPAAEVLTLDQSDWELWEGVLIQVQSVSVLNPDEGYGEWSVTDGTDTLYINNAGNYTYVPAAGDQFVSITGPLNYSYGNYKLIPRDDNDIVVIGPPRISNVAIDPASPLESEDVTVSATILDDGTFSAAIVYDAGSGEVNVTMSNTSGDNYAGIIPGQAAGTSVTYFVTATDNENNVGYSDTLSYVVLSAGGVITPIADIQDTSGTAFAADTSSLYGQEVTISGIVTAEFWGSSSNRYLFVQDAEGPWNGILVFEYGGWDNFAFQSAEGVVNSVAEGDSVTLTGTVDEYKGMTEITDVSEFIIHGPAVNMISPAAVTPGQIMTGGTDAEAYEGCLVGVSNVTVDNPDLGYGEWSVTDGTNSVRVDDKWDYYYWPAQDQALAEVVGCLDYSYGNTKIQPRLARDVVESGAVRIQRIQQVLYSDLLKAGIDEESDMSYMLGDTVTIVGIVTMPTGLSFAGAGVKFIYEDENGGPWSAILSYDPDSTAFPVLFEGDKISATGVVSEYSTGPSNMTELFITQPIELIDFGLATPAVPDVLTGDLRWPTEAEQWGTVMVRVNDAIVKENDLPYGEWSIDDGSGKVNVDDDSDSLSAWQEVNGRPPVGTFISSIKGWVYHHFGSYADSTTYKLEPLYPEDIVFGAGPPNIQNVSRDPCVPAPDEAVTVTCEITDNSTVASAEVMYSTDGVNYQSVAMSSSDGLTWSGTIPATNSDGARVDYYILATDDGADQDQPKTSSYPGDTEADQLGYVTKAGGISIADIQYTPWASGNSLYNGCEVTVTGIVTADTAQYTSSYGAYAIQSESAPWNGIVFDGWDDTQLTRGDEVTITGIVEEFDPAWHFKYDNNTKIIDVSSVTVNSTGNTIAPLVVSTADLAQDAEEVESYEGCLVKLTNVTVSSVNSYDWSVVDGSGIECLIDDDMATPEADAFMGDLEVGSTLETVTGILNFSFGTYKIQIRDMADLGQLGTDNDFSPVPHKFALYQNFPNPFNPETRIRFELASRENVKLVVYNLLGNKVRTLTNEEYNPGYHVLNWDGRNDANRQVSSGVYIYRIKAGDFVDHKKMVLLR